VLGAGRLVGSAGPARYSGESGPESDFGQAGWYRESLHIGLPSLQG
jgi:hypothetical protein